MLVNKSLTYERKKRLDSINKYEDCEISYKELSRCLNIKSAKVFVTEFSIFIFVSCAETLDIVLAEVNIRRSGKQ